MNVRKAELQHAISISTMRAYGPWEADVRTVEVESAISLTDESASGPMLTDVRTVVFELQFLPYLWARPDELLRCPDRCKLEQKLLDTMKGSDEKIRRPDRWCLSVWRPDGMTRHPDGLSSGQIDVRMGWHVVRKADRESEIFYLFHSAESSENALKSGIPVYNIFTHKWFCPNRMRPKY
jgi:hypothetical protein